MSGSRCFLSRRATGIVPGHADDGAVALHPEDATRVEDHGKRSVLQAPGSQPLAVARVRRVVVDQAIDRRVDGDIIEAEHGDGGVR